LTIDRDGLTWFCGIVATQLMIFFFDTLTRQDDVSIGFLYTLPTLMGFFVRSVPLLKIIVGLSSVLIVIGCFVPLPVDEDLWVFGANRVLAVIMVLITGGMIHYRFKLERTFGEALARERGASATQRAFVSMVSHEFRTPLTIIDAEAYRLTRLKETLSPTDIERRAGSIRDAVKRMVALIDRVLCSAQAEQNRINVAMEPVNLPELILSVCQERHRDSDNAIEFSAGDLPDEIIADKSLLTYVFDNLIGNAIKYSPGGAPIHVSGMRDSDGGVSVSVRDQGIGIPAEDISKLFDAYYRGGNVSSVPGNGVGLYIVRTFVRLHGGRVRVDSTMGQGSVFTVHLPLTPD
jgi:signal transduction histidine kinase